MTPSVRIVTRMQASARSASQRRVPFALFPFIPGRYRSMTSFSKTPSFGISDTERFQLFVASVTDYAIYMLSPEGYVDSWNAGAQRFKGYTADEILGQHFSRFYTEADRAAGVPYRALQTAREEGKFEDEGWRVRKDGTKFWAHVVVDPIWSESGELMGFAKVTRDVTERREAAEALARTKEALFQSQKLEAIGKLTGGIAHDFNNLLGVIVSGMELLSRETLTPSASKILDSMQRAADQGATLIQQLLTFARKQPFRQEKHNLNRVIRNFEPVLRQACKESIKFDLQLDPQLSSVLIDATQLETALLNLVTNARDSMPDGGMLTITTENIELAEQQVINLPAGRFAKVVIRDTGTGMPADVVSRAIEPFFTTKEPGKGTGMGLSQVYGFVQQSGGELVLETEIDKGTSVSLYIPAPSPEDSQTDTASSESDSGHDKALVVDDQPDVLKMAIELFQVMGYEVFAANNGTDALEILKRTPDMDVLFSDVLMPGMTGIALGQEARKLVPGIKVVLASGYPVPALAVEDNGFKDFDFINKPYRMTEIAKTLRKPDDRGQHRLGQAQC